MEERRILRAHHALLGIAAAMILVTSVQAQNIRWEGETGVFVTPLAYTARSPKGGLGHLLAAYHYFSGGGILGDFYNVSGTVGAFSRIEFGYARLTYSWRRP